MAGAAYVSGGLVQALFVLNIKDYVYESWQGTLLSFGFLLIAVACNTILAKRLPTMESLILILHIFGVFMFIPLWVLSPKRAGGSPFVEFYNPNGWISNGVATWAGINSPISGLIGFDCSVHMGMLIS
jgi:choline transport protein